MPDQLDSAVIFIAGPTASGKSRAALELAERVGGEIVNADAIQVYRDLEILSARPGPDALERAPHHLYGILDAAERCSAGRWARSAAVAVKEIHARGAPAIIVGGTGLYFRALAEGLSPIPETPDAVRAEARARLDKLGAEAFREEVLARDFAMARLDPNDTQRLLRAWEVYETSGTPLSAFQQAPRSPLIEAPAARIVIEPPRQALYRACDLRFDKMLMAGALEEARRLRGRALDSNLPVMKALGLPELSAHLAGDLSLDEAADRARRNTRRFAKRQLTWFRGQAANWPRSSGADEAVRLVESALGSCTN